MDLFVDVVIVDGLLVFLVDSIGFLDMRYILIVCKGFCLLDFLVLSLIFVILFMENFICFLGFCLLLLLVVFNFLGVLILVFVVVWFWCLLLLMIIVFILLFCIIGRFVIKLEFFLGFDCFIFDFLVVVLWLFFLSCVKVVLWLVW